MKEATTLDAEASYKVLGHAKQPEEGLSNIQNQQDCKRQVASDTQADEKAMMAIARCMDVQKRPKESDDSRM